LRRATDLLDQPVNKHLDRKGGIGLIARKKRAHVAGKTGHAG
jgi:hypothetical protein